jgi:transcriptional regulator with GAF, ATPase, and Fis domain
MNTSVQGSLTERFTRCYPAVMAAEATLMRACTVLFVFRALAQAETDEERAQLEAQILRLIGDLAGTEDTGGFILLAKSPDELTELARERGLDADLVARVLTDGAVDGAVPLYVRNAVVGILGSDANHGILAAVATLASAALETAREVEQLQLNNALLEEQFETRMIGRSAVMNRLFEKIGRLAPQDTTVLILGESGTGKEMVARALHRGSRRQQAPFVAINCAALTPALLESELFGHERGAFTDAVALKKGKLELAGSGTVFLDEIGELAHDLQAKLLRVLQQREFERVGGTKTLKLDARLLAATNRDLNADVRQGAFRADLFHRLNVVALQTPPLRERREDIPELAQYFLAQASARCCRRVEGISPEAERSLVAYDWPGNVRELANIMERAVVLGQSDQVQLEDLSDSGLEFGAAPDLAGAYQTSVGEAKRESIRRAWNEAGGDYKVAAAMLGLHPNSLLRLVRTLGMRDVLKS